MSWHFHGKKMFWYYFYRHNGISRKSWTQRTPDVNLVSDLISESTSVSAFCTRSGCVRVDCNIKKKIDFISELIIHKCKDFSQENNFWLLNCKNFYFFVHWVQNHLYVVVQFHLPFNLSVLDYHDTNYLFYRPPLLMYSFLV